MAGYNLYQGQIVGPIPARVDIMDLIEEAAGGPVISLKHIGIQTDIGSVVVIENKQIEIGKTGFYEINDTEITTLYFTQAKDENTIIDYVLKGEDE